LLLYLSESFQASIVSSSLSLPILSSSLISSLVVLLASFSSLYYFLCLQSIYLSQSWIKFKLKFSLFQVICLLINWPFKQCLSLGPSIFRCAVCYGRTNHVQAPDPISHETGKLIALLDHSYHQVLSSKNDAPLTIQVWL
jgi:hypothetical protein